MKGGQTNVHKGSGVKGVDDLDNVWYNNRVVKQKTKRRIRHGKSDQSIKFI